MRKSKIKERLVDRPLRRAMLNECGGIAAIISIEQCV
jgi:hypothetical protein